MAVHVQSSAPASGPLRRIELLEAYRTWRSEDGAGLRTLDEAVGLDRRRAWVGRTPPP